MTRIYNFFLFLLLSLVFALIVLTNKSYSAEKYVCSIWQASSFQIVDRVNDLSRCNDLYYENSDSENYQLFSRYSNTILSNETYANLKKKETKKQELLLAQKKAEEEKKKQELLLVEERTKKLQDQDRFLAKKYQVQVNQKNIDLVKDYFRKGLSKKDIAIGKKSIVKINSKDVTTEDLVNYIDETGIQESQIKKNLDKNVIEDLLSGLISTKILDYEIEEYNLLIDDETLLEIIKKNEHFHDENGIFQRTKYEKFLLSNNISAKTFETRLRKRESQKRLFDLVIDGTIGSNKKYKAAKAKEPKQEEFKPENKDVDNEAPIIDIADNVTVNNQTFTLKGKVTDKSKLYIEANNRPLTVAKNGEFKLEGFVVDPEAGEQIKLVAIDQWQNKSEKIIKINVEFKDVAELRSYADPNPNKIKVKEDKNKIAIIIGIEKYRFLKNIDAPYANRDANAFRAYANRALGISNKNIKILIDENATRGETLKALTLWLPQAAKGKNKDIYIFFAGHGLASDDGKNLYILPQDGDAALLQYTAISRLEMFELINKVEPNSVTMFFDTCYSGQTRDEEMLVAGLRPIRLTAEEQDTPNNFTIFTASNYDQTSGSINQAKHGIFSYYLMKGMEGQADSNQDKKITNGELIAYLKQNVSEEAFINNRQQEPMLSGDPDKVLISYN